MSQKLPKFNKPPVIETVLGIDFEPIHEFQIPYYGMFLLEIKDKYSKFVELQPINSQIEKFEGDDIPIATLNFGHHPEIRCLFLDRQERWRLQLQKNKFLSNWAKSTKISNYPSYDLTLRKFRENWNRFNKFLESNNLGKPKVQQCEVTYLNHIEHTNIENLDEIFPFMKRYDKNTKFLKSPEAVSTKLVYRIPEKSGRLRIEIKPVIRHVDLEKIIVLSLTAKVLPKSSKNKDVMDALNLGHEWVVKGFADITSDKMHKVWERR